MSSFDITRYYVHYDLHPNTHHIDIYLIRDLNSIKEYRLKRVTVSTSKLVNVDIHQMFSNFWNNAQVRMCSSEEDLLKEFEKMLGEHDLGDKPVKFPIKEDLELPPLPNIGPKDGDSYKEHKDHEVVRAQAGNKPYWYCRDCKVEVIK